MEEDSEEVGKGDVSMKARVMQGVSHHRCCKAPDFISSQRDQRVALGLDEQLPAVE